MAVRTTPTCELYNQSMSEIPKYLQLAHMHPRIRANLAFEGSSGIGWKSPLSTLSSPSPVAWSSIGIDSVWRSSYWALITRFVHIVLWAHVSVDMILQLRYWSNCCWRTVRVEEGTLLWDSVMVENEQWEKRKVGKRADVRRTSAICGRCPKCQIMQGW